ncbi:helix-turn-helix domain-containing protein [Pyxidicoccus sp. MSG2]|uniref:helix-turn-helix domain-containing protein n=1 Tax=Pyxidicoccus sp. MSG2 TaxID=2996790 RepID=UPI00226FA921|nr:XRE family transcriptional regulator [Pyxidicoccus sp. MSG2]MCY1018254.1 XRE family transcriptional regulator [Pyxidicoccus sp. MSG2]
MVTVAREARGLTQSELAKRLEISQGLLSKVEAGLSPINPALLQGLSRELGYPMEFFVQADPVYGPSTSEFFHRKKSSTPAKLLSQLHAQINIRRIHADRLLRSADPEECRIPRYDPDDFNGSAAEVARAVRAAFQLPRGPVKNVVDVIEDAGGIVFRWRFPTRQVDAVSWWVPGLPPIFVVNADIPADRARYTLCHELGHVVMHQTLRPGMEDEADVFAAEFLMPALDIAPYLQGLDSLQKLTTLKPYWKVSLQALLKRAADLNFIPEGRSRYLWIQLTKAGYRIREPPELDFPHEQPTAISELFELHRDELNYSVEQLSKLLTMYPEDLQQEYGVKPSPDERVQLRRVK